MRKQLTRTAGKKRPASYCLKRILKIIDSGEWEIRLVRIRGNTAFCTQHEIALTSVGYCDENDQVIYVDYRADILATIVHEFLHAAFEDMEEDDILRLEAVVMEHLTPKKLAGCISPPLPS